MANDLDQGLLAEFKTPELLLDAVKRTRQSGYRRIEAFTPFPVEGLADALGIRDGRVPWLGLIGGIFGALSGFLMQVYVNLDFPLNVGGRDVIAVPAFLVVTFELMILFAVLFPILGMLALNRLPCLHHPLFDVERFHLASVDRFFLYIRTADSGHDEAEARSFLSSLDPVSITKVAG
jgi:hypothetical protein